jgi:hypothetical protein
MSDSESEEEGERGAAAQQQQPQGDTDDTHAIQQVSPLLLPPSADLWIRTVLVARCHSFSFIFEILQCIQYRTFILLYSYSTFTRLHSLRYGTVRYLSIFSSLVSSVGKTSLGCRAENRTRACHTASRRTT